MKAISKLSYSRDEAIALGSADKATILEFIRWSVYFKETGYNPDTSKYFFDGHWWMQDSIQTWVNRLPWLSERTIKAYFAELIDRGYVARRKSTFVTGGSAPNFYRVIEREDAKTVNPDIPDADNAPRPGIGCTSPSAADAPPSSSISPTITQDYISEKTPNNEVAADGGIYIGEREPFETLFANLKGLEVCRVKFEATEYRKWTMDILEETGLSISELESEALRWQSHHNEKEKKPESPRSSFRVWLENYLVRNRGKNWKAQYEALKRVNKPLDPDPIVDPATLTLYATIDLDADDFKEGGALYCPF